MKIELKHVNYKYNRGLVNEVSALNDINLLIDEAENIALIGSTGSGKSTMIQLFNGLLEPQEGSVFFDGEALFEKEEMPDNKKAQQAAKQNKKKMLRNLRRKVGLVFQYPEYQLFDETVVADVSFGPKNLGFSGEEAKEKAEKALKMVGVEEDLFEKSPFELSGGEMRRVAVAGILAMEPEVLVLDEPTAGLDPQGKAELLDCIRNLQKTTGITVVFVSHNMNEVAEYADRVIAMHEGRIVFDGSTKEAFLNHGFLEEIGLRAPEATYICEALGIKGVITMEEAAEQIASVYGPGKK